MAGDVTIIVPVWNGRALVERLIASIHSQSCPAAEILIVDNGSSDGAPEAAERLGARVIRMGTNAGFSRAVNRGIRETRTGWLAIVNSDVELAADWLARLLEAAREPEVWFATGKILSAARRERIDGTWDALCRGGCACRLGHGRRDGPEFSFGRAIWFAPGTAVLYRTELFDRAGLLDEEFESYLEDVEFGLRCACLGYSGRYAPLAVAYHVGSATLGEWHPATVRRISRNQVLLLAKYYPAGILCRFTWPILVSQTLWGLVALRHWNFLAFTRGKIEGLIRFRSARRSACRIEAGRLVEILRESERDIVRVQRRTGFDWYWRVYLALTAGESD